MQYKNGKDFYDDDKVFDSYLELRKWDENPNQTLEQPIMLELLEGVKGKVLDMGCGYGEMGTKLLERGVESYLGLDASEKMISLGKQKALDPRMELQQANLETWAFPDDRYDCILSSLVLHYVEDLGTLLAKAHSGLKAGGKLVFSVEHPVLTSSMDLPKGHRKKTDWVVDQYFDLGERKQDWMGNRVLKYHRTLEAYWQLVTAAGFRIEEIREGSPDRSHFRTEQEFLRRKRIPLFLFMKAVKA